MRSRKSIARWRGAGLGSCRLDRRRRGGRVPPIVDRGLPTRVEHRHDPTGKRGGEQCPPRLGLPQRLAVLGGRRHHLQQSGSRTTRRGVGRHLVGDRPEPCTPSRCGLRPAVGQVPDRLGLLGGRRRPRGSPEQSRRHPYRDLERQHVDGDPQPNPRRCGGGGPRGGELRLPRRLLGSGVHHRRRWERARPC